jgi:hypothetical protein
MSRELDVERWLLEKDATLGDVLPLPVNLVHIIAQLSPQSFSIRNFISLAAVLGKRAHPDNELDSAVHNLELYYFISGEQSSHVVPVKIASTDSVRPLKEAINKKEKSAREDIKLSQLALRSLVSYRYLQVYLASACGVSSRCPCGPMYGMLAPAFLLDDA